jgi:hypothetical protein
MGACYARAGAWRPDEVPPRGHSTVADKVVTQNNPYGWRKPVGSARSNAYRAAATRAGLNPWSATGRGRWHLPVADECRAEGSAAAEAS